MPYELIFTSAQQGAGIGKSGYCTVAQTNGMTSDITLALEQTGVYHHVAAPGSGSNPIVYSYRMLDVSGDTFHVLSQIRDSGLDFTGRSNYLAHHLVFNSREINNLPSPAVILRHWNGWISDWGNQQPGFWEPTRFTQTNLNQLPQRLGPAQFWQAKTGDAANAAGLMEYGANQPIYWQCNPGEEAEMIQLFAEALQLADPTGQSFVEAWSYTFTTFLQQGDQPEQFIWRGVVPGTPAFQTAQSPQLLTQVRDPGNARSEFARTGKPQARAVEAREETGGGATALSLKRTPAGVPVGDLPGGRSTAHPKRKRSVKSSSKPSGRRKVGAPSRKWALIGGIAIGVCVLAGLMIGGISWLSSGDKKSDTKFAKKGDPKENGKGGNTSGGGEVDIGSLLNGTGEGGTGTGTGGTGTGGTDITKPVKPVAPPLKTDPKLLKFISENTVYLVGTTNGRFEMTDPEKTKYVLLGDFFKELKAHDTKHGYFSTDKKPAPTEFSPATYAMGTDPINLNAIKGIKYNAVGGDVTAPFHYHLDKMTIVMHDQNPAKKDKSIAFNFPGFATWGQAKRPWIHVAGNEGSGIKPFYLVPLETTQRGVALINLKVDGGIQFDDKAMTAKANPKTESTMKKLLKDNGLSGGIKFWAGAPLAKWGSAHLGDKNTIDLNVYMAEKKAAAEYGKNNVEAYKNNVQAAIDRLFPAAQAALTAQKDFATAKTEVGAAFKKGQALEGAGKQHLTVVMQTFKNKGVHNAKDLSQLFGREFKGGNGINPYAALIPADFNKKRFKDKFMNPVQVTPSEAQPESVVIQRKCQKYLDAKKQYLDAKKKWQEKVKAFNQKQAVLTQKSNAYATVINQLKGSKLDSAAIFDAGQIFQGNMKPDTAKKKWQANLDKAANRDWAKEIAKWDNPDHQKAEWNKFKKHPTFYLGAPVGTLIRFDE